MTKKHLRITYRPAEAVLAEGPLGTWDILPFEGNYYIPWRHVRARRAFRPNFLPGICVYKGLYVGMRLRLAGGQGDWNLGWLYWLPNPLFPFIWYRLALPGVHPDLRIEEWEMPPAEQNSKEQEVA